MIDKSDYYKRREAETYLEATHDALESIIEQFHKHIQRGLRDTGGIQYMFDDYKAYRKPGEDLTKYLIRDFHVCSADKLMT